MKVMLFQSQLIILTRSEKNCLLYIARLLLSMFTCFDLCIDACNIQALDSTG